MHLLQKQTDVVDQPFSTEAKTRKHSKIYQHFAVMKTSLLII